jgi:hypothetical protein
LEGISLALLFHKIDSCAIESRSNETGLKSGVSLVADETRKKMTGKKSKFLLEENGWNRTFYTF